MKHGAPPKDSLDDQQNRRRLAEFRHVLFNLHKTLIESERITYERVFGSITTSAKFLQLLIRDPWFAWLEPFSRLLVMIDERLDSQEPIDSDGVDSFVTEGRALLTPSEIGDGFPTQYFEALQRDPDVILAHADVVRSYGT